MERTDDSIATDTLPMPPRPIPTENEPANSPPGQPANQTCQNEEQLPTEDFEEIPHPHPDWQFNIFLNELADGLTVEDFKKMKFLLEGTGGISKVTLKEMENARDLFPIMRTRRLLSRDNLIYLQALLQKTGRVDLVKQAVEYANAIGNVLHFYPATSLPENGFKYVKFHVEGRNFRNGTREYVQNIRDKVAAILFIPPAFVIIAGVEPSCSLLITLMIPELYVTILEEMLGKGDHAAKLKDLSIDKVEIEKVYTIGEVDDAERDETDQQMRLANIYQQLEKKEKHLEKSEVERLRLQKDITKSKRKQLELEKKIFENESTVATMKKMFLTWNDESSPASLASQSALKDFQVALNQAVKTDKNVLQRILSANTAVVANRLKDCNRIIQQRLQLEVDELDSQLLPLKLEIFKHRFFSEIDVDRMDEILLESFRKLLQSIQVPVKVQLTEEGLQILKKISSKLRNQEKEKLSNKYTWSPDDELKQMMDNDQSFFLAGLWHKEMSDKRKVVHMVEFISQCLKEVGRTDLVTKLQDLLKGIERNTSRPKKKQNTDQMHRSRSVSRTDTKEHVLENEVHISLLERVANQVKKIYDTIEASKKSFAPECMRTKDFRFPFDPPPYSMYPCPQ